MSDLEKKCAALADQVAGYRRAFDDLKARVEQLVDPGTGPAEVDSSVWTVLGELRASEEVRRLERAKVELEATIARAEHYRTIGRVRELEEERKALIAARDSAKAEVERQRELLDKVTRFTVGDLHVIRLGAVDLPWMVKNFADVVRGADGVHRYATAAEAFAALPKIAAERNRNHCLNPDTCNPDKGPDGCVCACRLCA